MKTIKVEKHIPDEDERVDLSRHLGVAGFAPARSVKVPVTGGYGLEFIPFIEVPLEEANFRHKVEHLVAEVEWGNNTIQYYEYWFVTYWWTFADPHGARIR